MSWDNNIQYNPEKHGLRVVGELNDPEASYSFDDLIVWQHEDGRVFYATDSGCSCPSPFEDYNSVDDLTPVTNETWDEFQKAVEDHCKPYSYQTDQTDKLAAERTQLLSKVSALLPHRSTERKPRLYCAGPMRNRPHFNEGTFDWACKILEAGGNEPVSPADLDRAEGMDFSQYPTGTEPLPEGFDLQTLIRRDLDAIDTCDGIVLLPGWEHSSGAAVEVAYAKFLSKPVYDLEEFR